MSRPSVPINLAGTRMQGEDTSQLQSWRGVTGLLEESYLAEQQEGLIKAGQSYSSVAVRRNFTVPAALGDSRFGQSSASQSARNSPLSALFDLDVSSSHRSPLRTSRRSNGPSFSHTPSSIPTTPVRDSFPERLQLPLQESGLRQHHPGQRTSILTSPIRDSRYRASESSASPSRQASEATIRPYRYAMDAIPVKLSGTDAVMEDVLSMSPPAINDSHMPFEESTEDSSERERRAPKEELASRTLDRTSKVPVGDRTKLAIHISTETLNHTEGVASTEWDWRKRIAGVLKLSTPQQQILKCSIAYLIASLFTFVPAFSNLLSTTDSQGRVDVHGRIIRQPAYSAHMVATIVCYVCNPPSRFLSIQADCQQTQFHPARSAGGMILASKYCVPRMSGFLSLGTWWCWEPGC
jgi:hypothetical protein